MSPHTIYIGCAGWSVSSQHAALFGPGDSMLARYATRFDCVEINSCFYRPHQPKTYARWAASVPPHFRFSVKLPKAITHEARLRNCGDAMARFAGEVGELGERLGGVLVQLPPSLALDMHDAVELFAELREHFSVSLACEPRHRTWFEPEAGALWREFDIARVAADPARVPKAAVAGDEGAWTYTRWHGSPKIYYSEYGEERLRALAAGMLSMASPARPAWCILDNTALGHATTDAVRLQRLCGLRDAQSHDVDG